LSAIHFISHGSEGAVNLGDSWLNSTTLEENNDSISAWGDALDENGDILIYGCNLAETEDGQSLVNNLSELTLADVAASDDLTGHASLGGDWELEYAQGQIEAAALIDQDTAEQWHGLLAPAEDDSYSTSEEDTLNVAASGVLMNDAPGVVTEVVTAGHTLSYDAANDGDATWNDDNATGFDWSIGNFGTDVTHTNSPTT
ncbi:MAG: DUF4347 domain-containing protein, partial [Actinomycetia bacterium]|nr:DUF4347 domain-containing protein [Actinomycetes bacterium]